jgi:hypothetical protein
MLVRMTAALTLVAFGTYGLVSLLSWLDTSPNTSFLVLALYCVFLGCMSAYLSDWLPARPSSQPKGRQRIERQQRQRHSAQP